LKGSNGGGGIAMETRRKIVYTIKLSKDFKNARRCSNINPLIKYYTLAFSDSFYESSLHY